MALIFKPWQATVRVSEGAGFTGFCVTDSVFGFQFGGGVNARVGESAAIRAGVDYTMADGVSQIRAVAGIAFAVGGR